MLSSSLQNESRKSGGKLDEEPKISVGEYSQNLFKDSLLTGVSSIADSKGWYLKFVKSVILLVAMAGYSYQCFEFSRLYTQYETMATERTSVGMVAPAFTICDENWITRKFFCQNARALCIFYKNLTEFCELYPVYCHVPKRNIYPAIAILQDALDVMSYVSSAKDSKQSLSTFFLDDTCFWNFHTIYDAPQRCSYSVKVRWFSKAKRQPSMCWLFQSVYRGAPILNMKEDFSLFMHVKWSKDQALDPFKPRRYFLSVHDPQKYSNPFNDGIEIEEHKVYYVDVRQETTIRLPPPYETQCQNYDWVGKHFPVIGYRDHCKTVCELHEAEKKKCISRYALMPHNMTICKYDKGYDFASETEKDKCIEQCTEDCKEIKYNMQKEVLSTAEVKTNLTSEMKNIAFSTVTFIFRARETKIIEHKPVYQTVDIFSYIGGYMGLWLGWSLIAMLDLVMAFMRIVQFAWRKKYVPMFGMEKKEAPLK